MSSSSSSLSLSNVEHLIVCMDNVYKTFVDPLAKDALWKQCEKETKVIKEKIRAIEDPKQVIDDEMKMGRELNRGMLNEPVRALIPKLEEKIRNLATPSSGLVLFRNMLVSAWDRYCILVENEITRAGKYLKNLECEHIEVGAVDAYLNRITISNACATLLWRQEMEIDVKRDRSNNRAMALFRWYNMRPDIRFDDYNWTLTILQADERDRLERNLSTVKEEQRTLLPAMYKEVHKEVVLELYEWVKKEKEHAMTDNEILHVKGHVQRLDDLDNRLNENEVIRRVHQGIITQDVFVVTSEEKEKQSFVTQFEESRKNFIDGLQQLITQYKNDRNLKSFVLKFILTQMNSIKTNIAAEEKELSKYVINNENSHLLFLLQSEYINIREQQVNEIYTELNEILSLCQRSYLVQIDVGNGLAKFQRDFIEKYVDIFSSMKELLDNAKRLSAPQRQSYTEYRTALYTLENNRDMLDFFEKYCLLPFQEMDTIATTNEYISKAKKHIEYLQHIKMEDIASFKMGGVHRISERESQFRVDHSVLDAQFVDTACEKTKIVSYLESMIYSFRDAHTYIGSIRKTQLDRINPKGRRVTIAKRCEKYIVDFLKTKNKTGLDNRTLADQDHCVHLDTELAKLVDAVWREERLTTTSLFLINIKEFTQRNTPPTVKQCWQAVLDSWQLVLQVLQN